jgi:hypothetical protein
MLNTYPQGVVDSVINCKGSNSHASIEKNFWTLCNPIFEGCFRRVQTLGKFSILKIHLRTRPKRDLQQMAECISIITCECDRRYIDKTCRPLALWLCEHRHNLRAGLQKSKFAQHAYKEGN